MNTRRTSTRLAVALGTAALGLAMSGCTYLNDTQTHYFYQAAEGANVNVQQQGTSAAVGVRNLLAVTSGSTTHLTGSAINQTLEEHQVKIAVVAGGSGSTTVTVPAGESVEIGGAKGVAITTTEEPGGVITLEVTAAGETHRVNVQVLDDSLEYLGDTSK